MDNERKTGILRLAELFGRDFKAFFGAGFLALLGCGPFLLGFAVARASHSLLLAPLAGLLGGAIAGPELYALADAILRPLRDEPGFWWHTYKRVWRRNAKASLLPGALTGLLLGSQLFLLFHTGAMGLTPWMGAVLGAGILIVTGLSLYLWPQLALMDLTLPQLVRNAALLFLGQLPRSVAALALVTVYWGVVLLCFRLVAFLLLFTNFWLVSVPALFLIYPGLEKNFHIEEQIRAIQYPHKSKT